MRKILPSLLLLALTMSFHSCRKDVSGSEKAQEELVTQNMRNGSAQEKTNTFYGPQVHVGNGKVRSWIVMTHDRQPIELGIEMTPGALENLPDAHGGEAHPNWNIPFHQKVRDATPFDHLTLNWNPAGHAPVFSARRISTFTFT